MRRIAVIGLAVLATLGLILGIWATVSISSKWSGFQDRVRELEAETAPAPTHAWEHYQSALSRFQDSSILMVTGEPLPEGEPLLEIKARIGVLAPAFESIRAGARSGQARPGKMQVDVDVCGLGRAAVLQARMWRLEGRLKEAADLVLSVATFARDIADNGDPSEISMGLQILDDAWEEVRLLISEKGLSADESAEIGRQLEALDRRFPKVERALRLGVLWNAQQLLRKSSKFEYLMGDYPLRARPRSLYSLRLHKVQAFERWEYYLERFRGLDKKSWSEIDQINAEISKEFVRGEEDVLKLPLSHFTDQLGPVRESLAQLRLLRVALAFRRTGSAASLPDPFDGTIGTEISGSSIASWSKGMGVTDRTTGTWKRADDVMEALNRGALRIDLTR